MDFSSEVKKGSTFVFSFGVDIPDAQRDDSHGRILRSESPEFPLNEDDWGARNNNSNTIEVEQQRQTRPIR